ncbi:MAG: hypothetical protein J6D25_06360 [Eggerthellaceae bacterium]|nr:hypothetical protein [Eggerthellaceae bacterium]
MAVFQSADVLHIQNCGYVCMVALDEHLDFEGDCMVSGEPFVVHHALYNWKNPDDRKPMYGIMLGDKALLAGWFVGKRIEQA